MRGLHVKGLRPASVQTARDQPEWLAAQAAKLRAFVCDPASKTLTCAGLSRAQAATVTALAAEYRIVSRPMPPLLNRHRLQLINSAAAALPTPALLEYAQGLTPDEVQLLREREDAALHILRCAVGLLRVCLMQACRRHVVQRRSATPHVQRAGGMGALYCGHAACCARAGTR